MDVQVSLHRERAIRPEQVMELYQNVNWWPARTADEIAEVLEQHPAVGVWDGDRLIGFARAVTDGRFRAYIEDVVVHSEYRRHAVGEQLIARLLQEIEHIDVISLFCEPELAAFYGRNGFKQNRSQVVLHRKGT